MLLFAYSLGKSDFLTSRDARIALYILVQRSDAYF